MSLVTSSLILIFKQCENVYNTNLGIFEKPQVSGMNVVVSCDIRLSHPEVFCLLLTQLILILMQRNLQSSKIRIDNS